MLRLDTIPAHIQAMLDEHAELNIKIKALEDSMHGSDWDGRTALDQNLLIAQKYAMVSYALNLGIRIHRATGVDHGVTTG